MKNMKVLLFTVCAGVLLAGCHTDMWYQAKVTPYDPDESGVFIDGAANRPLPRGAVAQGWAKLDDTKYTGYEGNQLTNKFPATLVLDGDKVDTNTDMIKVMKRGKERFHIYCSHCHGEAGDGKGMITQRGLVLKREPPSFHTERLRTMPIGHFYDVTTNGFGIMFSQASRVLPDDRWAIAAYIRALQLSQNAKQSELSDEDLQGLQDAVSGKTDTAHGKEKGKE